MNIPYVFKRCTKCGEWMVANKINFYKDKKGKYNLTSACKSCRNKYHEQWYNANNGYVKDYHKQYYQNNKDYFFKKTVCYYAKNKDILLIYNKQYRTNNKESIAIQRKKYRELNRDYIIKDLKLRYKNNIQYYISYRKKYYSTPQGQITKLNSSNKRRINKLNQGSGINSQQWLDMMGFFDWRCAYSGEYLGGKNNIQRSIDHIKPLSKGGSNEIWNCIPMLKSYNSSKYTNDMEEWYKKQEFYLEERLQKIYEWQQYAKGKWAEKGIV